MSPREALASAVLAKLPGAEVEVSLDRRGYAVTTTSEKFRGMDRASREALVYAGLCRIPVTLLARVHTLECLLPEPDRGP